MRYTEDGKIFILNLLLETSLSFQTLKIMDAHSKIHSNNTEKQKKKSHHLEIATVNLFGMYTVLPL